jgi:hypothetical protein
MRHLRIVFYSFLLLSCVKKESLPLENENNTVIHENIEASNNVFVKERNYEIEIINYGHKNKGIYFPEYYIGALLETRSHMIASNILYELPNNNRNNAIIIFEDEIMYVYNYHEGITRSIIDYNDKEIFIENFYNEENRIYIADNSSIINENDILFIKINEKLDDWRSELNSYITKIIFGDVIYTNEKGDEIFRMRNGNISYNNIEYTIGTDTVFANSEYDILFSRGHDNIYFRVYCDIISIFELILTDDLLGDPMGQRLGEYILVDEYR